MTGLILAVFLFMGAILAVMAPKVLAAIMAGGAVAILAVIWALGRTGLSDGPDNEVMRMALILVYFIAAWVASNVFVSLLLPDALSTDYVTGGIIGGTIVAVAAWADRRWE